MAQSNITLYVDIVSPFAYIAFYILKVRVTSLSIIALFGAFVSAASSDTVNLCSQDQHSPYADHLSTKMKTNRLMQNSPAFKQCEIKYVPIFLGGLMNACGNTPPIAIKSEFDVGRYL